MKRRPFGYRSDGTGRAYGYGGLRMLVSGLRESAPPTDCRVYQANPDGTVGEFLRMEKPREFQPPRFNTIETSVWEEK